MTADVTKLISPDLFGILQKTPVPSWIPPMKATLTSTYFWRNDWAYEWKLDGQRILAIKQDRVTLYSRNQLPQNNVYPEIVDALELAEGRWWVDGEIVAFEGENTTFKKLQKRMHLRSTDEARKSPVEVFYYLFDCMYANGYDLRNLPYLQRRRVLHELITTKDPLRLLNYVTHGKAYFWQACQKGWEGVIAKDMGSIYESRRSKKWLKFKCSNEQEFIIMGYTEPQGSRLHFGAILVGYYDDGELKYAGKVGTGSDADMLQSLYEKFQAMETDTPPLKKNVRVKGVHWLRPELVAQIGFTEWTDDHKLRHPRFLGLRSDKPPQEVMQEVMKEPS